MKKSILVLVVSILFTSISLQTATAQSWNITGNSNATSSSKLGTTNLVPLRFFTNNTERLRIDETGKVGIGITTPVNILTVKSGGGTPAASWLNGLNSPVFAGFGETVSSEFLLAGASNTAGNRAVFQGRRSRGTLAAPAAVVNNDYITSLLASAYDGSTFQNPALVSFFVDGVPSAGNVPTRISFVTGSNAVNRIERLKVGSTGNFNFNNNQLFLQQSNGNVGIGTTSPGAKLDVLGTGIFSGALTAGSASVATGVSGTGNNKGVLGYSSGGYGVYGNSGYYGVYGSGGTTGVYGIGGSYGTYGYSSGGNGVYGTTSSGYGVYGTGGPYGVYGNGSKFGVWGNSSDIGVFGNGDNQGTYGYSGAGDGASGYSSTGNGVYGKSSGGFGASFYSESSWGLRAETNTGFYAGVFYGNVLTSGSYLTSDKNLKKNVQDFSSAMSIINKLKPKYYEFKDDAKYASLHLPKGNHYGLLAQDLEQVLPTLINESAHEINVNAAAKSLDAKNPTAVTEQEVTKESITIKAVNYMELIPIMIKGMQEQQVQIKELITKNMDKDARIDALQKEMEELKAIVISGNSNNSSTTVLSSASLDQNKPNPFTHNTSIGYTLPQKFTIAQIRITDNNGKTLKVVNVSGSGKGTLNVDAKILSSGAYNYSLFINGKLVSTKQMERLK